MLSRSRIALLMLAMLQLLCLLCVAASASALAVPRRALFGAAATGATAAAAEPARAALGPALFPPVEKVSLSEEEVETLLGGYGRTEVDIVYAPNGARFKLAENEVNEMQRLGFLVLNDAKEKELRTFTPRYWFPVEPGENWYAPPFRRLSFEFTESNKARKEKAFALSDVLRARAEAKAAVAAKEPAPAGYVAPEPVDPTMCGDKRVGQFKCDEIAKPGAYLQRVQEKRLEAARAAVN